MADKQAKVDVKEEARVDDFIYVRVSKSAKESALSIAGKVIFFEDGIVKVNKKYEKEVAFLKEQKKLLIMKKATFETGKVKLL